MQAAAASSRHEASQRASDAARSVATNAAGVQSSDAKFINLANLDDEEVDVVDEEVKEEDAIDDDDDRDVDVD